jgi:transcriptional regulator with XRE-family HTH domain
MPKRAKNPADGTAEEFGRRLAKLLEDAGQGRHGAGVYLSKRYGVSVVTANSWLKGEYRPNTARAREIAQDHGTTFDMLYFGRKTHAPVRSDPLSEREQALIQYFRQLDDADKQSIERLAGSLARAKSAPERKVG